MPDLMSKMASMAIIYYNAPGKEKNMRLKMVGVIIAAMFFLAGLPAGLWAAAVGSLVQVEGNVELLRAGKLPAIPAKVRDQLEAGDVIRTKSGARAQVRFVDDSVLTLAPGSMVAIEKFFYDGPKGLRQAVLNVFRGLAACVVSQLVQAEQPNFLMQTHTAALGVRGTKWYTLLGAAYTSAFNERGMLEVGSVNPAIKKKVVLLGGETSTVTFDRVTDPVRYPDALRRLLENWLQRGVPEGVINMSPLELPWLQRPGRGVQFPERFEDLPEGLFVPPSLRGPELRSREK
jgi:hypothetical protein